MTKNYHTTAERRAIEAAYYAILRLFENGDGGKFLEREALPAICRDWQQSKVGAQAIIVDLYHEGMTNGKSMGLAAYASYPSTLLKIVALGASKAVPEPDLIVAALAAQKEAHRRELNGEAAK